MSKDRAVYKVGDYIINLNSGAIGKVIEVNNHWGWMRVKYEDRIKEYGLLDTRQSIIRMTDEARADYFLALENAGITSYWE